mgnify:CR=1 FL=1
MTTLKITPAKLNGSVCVPSSKSMGHREIICAGLSAGTSIVDNISMSADMEATLRCLTALGIGFQKVPSERPGRTALAINGSGNVRVSQSTVDCGESGSTLRFMIPLGALCGAPLTFTGHGKLVTRPLQAYYDIFDMQGLSYTTASNGYLPLTVNGVLKSGDYELPGNVSSQFISGLLFALPLMFGNLLRECGVLNSLSETAQNVLANLITLLLGLTVAGQMTADKFVRPDTLLIMALGLVAFIFDTAGGVLFAKLVNLFLPEGKKLNPMIGAAGISAFPMSGRVVNKMGLAEDNQNFLLMYSISVNVSGQIASVIAGGLLLTLLS